MSIAHMMASGLGGIRTSGDLVARMQFARKMKAPAAKEYVAKKLGVSVLDLTDVYVMRDLREALGIGVTVGLPGAPRGIAAKMNIEKLLDIEINCCEIFRKMTSKR